MKESRFEECIIALFVIVMVTLVGFQVLSRYIFHFSLSYTEEIVRYLFVWATFIGIGMAVRGDRHLTVMSPTERGSGGFRRIIRLFIGVCALGFAGVLFVYGTKIVLLQGFTGQKTAALGAPMWIVGLAVPAGAALVIFRIVRRIRPGDDG